MTKSSNATPGLSVGAVNTAHMNKNVKKKKKTNNFHKQKIKKEEKVKTNFIFKKGIPVLIDGSLWSNRTVL